MEPPVQHRDPVDTLSRLRAGLLHLHKELLDSERDVYEREIAKIDTAGRFLVLVMEDPFFAWLRELSRLIVQIDEKLDDSDDPATEQEALRYLTTARALLVPAESGQGFEKRYFEALQRDPNVVMTHAATTRLIAALKSPPV